MLAPTKPLTQSRAIYCFVVNQLATPGLGSLMGGRPLAGGGQITVALIGFFLMIFWFFQTMKAYYGIMVGGSGKAGNVNFLIAGALVFAVSWIWSLVTSISLIREAKVEPPTPPTPPKPPVIPPVITKLPPKM